VALVIQYEKEGNWEEAKKICERAHEVDPSAPFVAVNVALPLAQTVEATGMFRIRSLEK
jgi:hypothetical protein